MRGADEPQTSSFKDVSVEDRISADHPLRTIHTLANSILTALSPKCEALCLRMGRPPTLPERLLRTLLLQVVCTARSARHLMAQLNYNLLFR